MKRRWLPVATVVLLLSGCTPNSEPPRPAPPVASHPVTKPLPAGAERPIAKPQAKPANRLRDEFDLPLVIEMEVPEAPPEIQNLSPSIKEERNLP